YGPSGLPGQGQFGLGQPFITPPGIQNGNVADLDIFVREGQTGQFMIGAGINSDAGLTGQLTISERNFDLFRLPRSFSDITNGEAFRGRGQSFRLEALPGTQVQRYLVSFGEPYFYMFGQPFSFNTSGYYFTRGYFDWDEQRLGGTVSLGYRLTQDVSLSVSAKAEDVTIFNPRLNTSPELNAVVGDNELYSLSVGLTHDTRDHPFLSSQGHFLSFNFTQAFGNFDYSRGDMEYRKYWLLTQRPDGSGKQTISHSTKLGVTGSQTPVFENYFAGGFSTMRGFDFRGASPVDNGVIVGGEFQFLNTLEYTFPITADDMFKGVLFCDYGTVEQSVTIDEDNFRVVPGFGFRINLPVGGAGGAPLAFDFGFPVASAETDERRIFSFYMAVLR
ncbi:MAG: BamA/TamA family outer membrane protein, partial [Planctomycetota bacterium]|nr:BamA/TamA family outer membrane protein [Planctomycetota bacterium]